MLPLCLIISHDPHLIAAIQREIEGCGLKPYQVRSFSAALGLISQWRFDAVLVDADGFGEGFAHTLPELRDRARAPILMLSSSADPTTAASACPCSAVRCSCVESPKPRARGSDVSLRTESSRVIASPAIVRRAPVTPVTPTQ